MEGQGRFGKWALGVYFVLFVIFMYGPSILMAILSFQGQKGGITFPMEGFGGSWWKALWDEDAPLSKAAEIKEAGKNSLYLALACGALTSFLAFTLSYAFRRRFKGDGVVFYLVLLCLMAPGFLLGLGTALFWQTMGLSTGMWKTALGSNAIWALPFAFLVMMAVWNRYDKHIEEASRDLGADAKTTFREVTLPLVWTGIFGCFLFGFTLSWNEYDRTVLALASGEITLPIQIFSFTTAGVIRPDLYALGTFTTVVSLLAMGVLVVFGILRLRKASKAGGVTLETKVAEEMGQATEIDAGAGARAK